MSQGSHLTEYAKCPCCGTSTHVRALDQLIAEAERGHDEPARAPAADRTPATRRGEDYTMSESGDEGDLGQSVFDFTMAAVIHVFKRTIGQQLKRHYRDRVLPEAERAGHAYLQRQLHLAGRHPDLRVCLRDRILFTAGGTRTMPITSLFGPRQTDPELAIDALAAQLRAP